MCNDEYHGKHIYKGMLYVNKYLSMFGFVIMFNAVQVSVAQLISFSMIHFIDNKTLAYYNLTHPDET